MILPIPLGQRSALEATEPFRRALFFFLSSLVLLCPDKLWGGSGRPFFSPPSRPPLNRRPRRAPRLGRALEAEAGLEAAVGRFPPIGCDNGPLLANPAAAGISADSRTFSDTKFSILVGYRIPTVAHPQHGCGAASAAPSFPHASRAAAEQALPPRTPSSLKLGFLLLTNSAVAGISVGRGGTFPAAGFLSLQATVFRPSRNTHAGRLRPPLLSRRRCTQRWKGEGVGLLEKRVGMHPA